MTAIAKTGERPACCIVAGEVLIADSCKGPGNFAIGFRVEVFQS